MHCETRPRARQPFRSTLIILTLLLFTVAAGADCDTDAPQLTGFVFAPTGIDVTSTAAGTTCNMTFSDSPSGVEEATCSFRAPGFLQTHSCTSTSPVAGDRQNGTFSCTVTLPRYAEAGVWKASVTATDGVGNFVSVSDFELLLGGFPSDLSVTSSSDVLPPVLTAFDFTPQNIDVSAAAVDVDCSMSFTDALAGVARAACYFEAPLVEQSRTCIATVPSSGTRNNGTFVCTISVPRYAAAGTWVASVIVWDQTENLAGFDSAAIQALGDPTDLGVTASPQDLLAPSLLDFEFSPASADTTSGPVNVTCTMDVADAPAGVEIASCSFSSPTTLQEQGCFALSPSSGTRNNGTFSCSVTLPQYAEGGTWKASVDLLDGVGNPLEVDSFALAAAALPTDLEVECGGSGGGAGLRFTSQTTAIWDPVADALYYNIYRGPLAALMGGGYGSCWTANDPNPTDTTFTDPELPAQAGDGFFYLVSFRTIAGEGGLGTDSSGTPRVVDVPCP